MPKRARQAHIPKQTPSRRRKARRPAVVTGSDAYLDVSGPISAAPFGREPVAPIPLPTRDGPRPRAQHAQASRPPVRASGQLPVFERSYLVEELRRIATTAGGLLILIIILALVLR